MTAQQIKNLKTLAEYLKRPLLAADFTMRVFSDGLIGMFKATDCGTVGCALGHGPYAGIAKEIGLTWLEYSCQAFGVAPYSREYYWLFDAQWHKVDDTPKGAARRIEIFLERGIPATFKVDDLIPGSIPGPWFYEYLKK